MSSDERFEVVLEATYGDWHVKVPGTADGIQVVRLFLDLMKKLLEEEEA